MRYSDMLSILIINCDNFEQLFLLSGCGYCKKLKPEFAEAATLLKSNFVSLIILPFHLSYSFSH